MSDGARFCSNCGIRIKQTAKVLPEKELTVNEPEQIHGYEAASNNQVEVSSHEVRPKKTVSPLPKRLPWILIAAAVVIVVGGWAVFAFGNFGPVKTAQLAPLDTSVFVVIKPNSSQLANIDKLKNVYTSDPKTKEVAEELLREIQREFGDNTNFENMSPWIGTEVAFFARLHDNQSALVLQSRNTKEADEYIEMVAQQQGNMAKETYEEITIVFNDREFVGTQIEGYVILSNSKSFVKEIIDRANGQIKDNLTQNEEYELITRSLSRNRSGLCYLNMQEILNAVNPREPIQKDIAKYFGSYRSIGLSLSFENDGIRSDYVVTDFGIPHPDSALDDADLKATLEMLPTETIGFINLPNLFTGIKYVVNNVGLHPDIEYDLGLMESRIGINFKNDILGFLRGDALLAILNPYELPIKTERIQMQPSFVFAMGLNEPESVLEKTDRILDLFGNKNYYLRVDKQNIAGNPAFFVSTMGYDYEIKDSTGLCLLDDLFLIGSSREVLETVVKKDTTLNQEQSFRAAFAPYPNNWVPILYLNVEKLTDFFDEALNEYRGYYGHDQKVAWYTEGMGPLIKPIKLFSVAESGYNEKTGILQGGFFINIQ